jgi:MFS family permease
MEPPRRRPYTKPGMAARPLYDLSGIARVFTNRNYAIYAGGQSISLIGLWVQRLAVGWLAWELTKSGFWLGAVAFADLFPVMFIGLFGGVLADRVDQRHILLVGQVVSLVQSTVLWAMTLAGVITIGWLVGLTLCLGMVVALMQPARLSLVPSLVRKEDVGGAVAIHAVIFNLARFLGPAAAGLIIASSNVANAFLFNAASFVPLIVALLLLRIAPRAARPPASTGVFADVGSGLRYAFGHPGIAPTLLLMGATSLLVRPVFELLPGFADHVFHSDARGLATLTSSVGLGALFAGLWLAQRASAARFASIAMASAVALCLAGLVFGSSSNLGVGAVALAVAGFTSIGISVTTQTLLQTGVDPAMRGRVLSIWGIVLRAVPAAGALVMGWISDYAGLRAPLVGASLLCLAAGLLLTRTARRDIRALEHGLGAPRAASDEQVEGVEGGK